MPIREITVKEHNLAMKITIFIKTLLPLCVIPNFQTILKCRLQTFDIAGMRFQLRLKWSRSYDNSRG